MEKSLICDFYELTMANSYFQRGLSQKTSFFDYYFRQVPDNGGYVITAGLGDFIDYLINLRFSDSDIEFLRSKQTFSSEFLDYLKTFKFTGDIYAIPEGSVVFPNEPIITVVAPIIEAQLIETFLLLTLNHQSLIATKASRIVQSAKGRQIMEFGARRSHNISAAIYGAKAAYIAGVKQTSLTYCDKYYNIKAVGTMAHSYISSFDTEYDAFLAYAKTYPNDVVLLLDTYDTLNSGIVNAIKLYNEYLKPNNLKLKGVRIDSGDIIYLSKQVRKILDDNFLNETKIILSNSLDEYSIKNIIDEGGCVDIFGIGERLITAKSDPILGGVYKLAAIKSDNRIIPKIKLSDTLLKTTTPGFKKVYRVYDKNNKAIADLISLYDEQLSNNNKLILFDPNETWKKKEIVNYNIVLLTKQYVRNGKLIELYPTLDEVADNCFNNLNTMWDEVKRFDNPFKYYVDLTKNLWDLKQELINNASKK